MERRVSENTPSSHNPRISLNLFDIICVQHSLNVQSLIYFSNWTAFTRKSRVGVVFRVKDVNNCCRMTYFNVLRVCHRVFNWTTADLELAIVVVVVIVASGTYTSVVVLE